MNTSQLPTTDRLKSWLVIAREVSAGYRNEESIETIRRILVMLSRWPCDLECRKAAGTIKELLRMRCVHVCVEHEPITFHFNHENL